MPEKETLKRAARDKREGKAPSTQAGEFIREEIHHIREGKHGARSTKQAIAIGLSKARRSGVALPPPKKGTVSAETRRSAARRDREGSKRSRRQAVAAPRARREGRVAGRRAVCRVEDRARSSGPYDGPRSRTEGTVSRGAEGGPHQGRRGSVGRRAESRADSRPRLSPGGRARRRGR
jgi:hypothetical protein